MAALRDAVETVRAWRTADSQLVDAVGGAFFFSSRRRHTRWNCDRSSDVCSSDLDTQAQGIAVIFRTEVVDAQDLNRVVEIGDAQIRYRAGRARYKPPHIFRSSQNRRGGDKLAAEHAPEKILVKVLIVHRVDHTKHRLSFGGSGRQCAKDHAAAARPPLPLSEEDLAQLPQGEIANRILVVDDDRQALSRSPGR